MSNKVYQLHDENGNGILPMTVADAVACGHQSLTQVLMKLLGKLDEIQQQINNLSESNNEKLTQLITDVADLKERMNYEVIWIVFYKWIKDGGWKFPILFYFFHNEIHFVQYNL